MRRLAFISCVSMKSNKACEVKDMYISPLFKYSYKFASNAGVNEIYILSAKYGVIKDDKIIEPYNTTLNKMSRDERIQWSENVNLKLEDIIKNDDKILLLAGSKYIEFLKFNVPSSNIYNPLKNMPIGKRLQYLKNANISS